MHLNNPTLYALDIIEALMEAGYFNKDQLMDPIALFNQLEKASARKYKETGETALSEDEITACYDKAVDAIVDQCIQTLLESGDVKIAGVDPNGELIYKSTKPKDYTGHEVTAKFEQFLPNGPNISLN